MRGEGGGKGVSTERGESKEEWEGEGGKGGWVEGERVCHESRGNMSMSSAGNTFIACYQAMRYTQCDMRSCAAAAIAHG